MASLMKQTPQGCVTSGLCAEKRIGYGVVMRGETKCETRNSEERIQKYRYLAVETLSA